MFWMGRLAETSAVSIGLTWDQMIQSISEVSGRNLKLKFLQLWENERSGICDVKSMVRFVPYLECNTQQMMVQSNLQGTSRPQEKLIFV